MRKLLFRIASWILEKYLGYTVIYLSPDTEKLVEAAFPIVQDTELIPGVISGEYRFSVALGKLWKYNQQFTKRDCALAIELAIQRGAIEDVLQT